MKKLIPFICCLFLFGILQVNAQTPLYELWGMTYWGGQNNAGAIMNIGETVLDTSKVELAYSLGSPLGAFPMGNSLLFGKDSLLYGMTTYGGVDSMGELFSYNPANGVYTDIMDFDSINGAFPYGNLVQDTATGAIYGMTSKGGVNNVGVIFGFYPDSIDFVMLHQFAVRDGAFPMGNLFLANNTTLYGMTDSGGYYNLGVIFRFNPSTRNLDTLHSFNNTWGMLPTGGVIQDSNSLYGMTPYGGANDDGVLFSFNLYDSTFTDLLDFNYANGSNPYGSLFKASNGKLYGTTENGVDSVSDGVIFSYNPDSNSYSILYVFYNDSVGANPSGSFIQGHDGNLYAATQWGGTHYNGVIFKFNPDSNTYTDIFNLNNALAGTPYGDLTETPYIMGTTAIVTVTKNTFSIFPNPSSGIINVISPSIINTVKITDLLGRVIYTSTPKQTNLTLDINNAGMYFITITSNTQTSTNKIIISK